MKMSNLSIAFVDKIVETCFDLYKNTPKTGKPIDKEWTVLCCIVKLSNNHAIEVVSLGTGSKCIGASKMSPKGDILNDSHAEVFARRGFLLYLYDNIDKALENEPSLFSWSSGKLQLKDDIEFAFYSSQLPCGDASIIPMSENDEEFGEIIDTKKRKLHDCVTEHKKLKLDNDIHRTGAKCLPNSEQDAREPGDKYHTLGQVRTKPGRGDRTLSVSCSDKIAKWIHLGVQGSLLSLLSEPIYIKHFIFGAGAPYSEESLHRALLGRDSRQNVVPKIIPFFYQSSLQFANIRTEQKIRPAPGSIVWVKLDNPILEVAVQGKKLGVTKKKETLPKNWLCICKYNIYKTFIDLVKKHNNINETIFKDVSKDSVPYNEMKKQATDYIKQWVNLKEQFFKIWTLKPDMWNFCTESS